MRRAAARQTHPRQPLMGRGRGRGGHGDARGGGGGWATGGEIFAKTAKTPPLQSGVARMPLRSKCRPIAPFTCPLLPPRIPPPMSRVDSTTTRRAASLSSHSPFPIYAHLGANDGRWRCIATESPPMPTVGAGSSQREDSPAHLSTICTRPAGHSERPTRGAFFGRDAARHVATKTAPSLRSHHARIYAQPSVGAGSPFWEYGGLNPIPPFLGGRSEAACRVVFSPSRHAR